MGIMGGAWDPTVTKCLSMSLSEILGHFINVTQKAHGNTGDNTST